jgi:hypothetical protein
MTKLGIGAGIVCAFFILFIILTSVVPGIAAITSVLIVILICAGFIGLICFFVNANNRHNRRRQELTNQMAGIKNNVFNPLGARIELSTHGSYISIWFDWKANGVGAIAQPISMMMQPANMLMLNGSGFAQPAYLQMDYTQQVYMPQQPQGYQMPPQLYSQPQLHQGYQIQTQSYGQIQPLSNGQMQPQPHIYNQPQPRPQSYVPLEAHQPESLISSPSHPGK